MHIICYEVRNTINNVNQTYKLELHVDRESRDVKVNNSGIVVIVKQSLGSPHRRSMETEAKANCRRCFRGKIAAHMASIKTV